MTSNEKTKVEISRVRHFFFFFFVRPSLAYVAMLSTTCTSSSPLSTTQHRAILFKNNRISKIIIVVRVLGANGLLYD